MDERLITTVFVDLTREIPYRATAHVSGISLGSLWRIHHRPDTIGKAVLVKMSRYLVLRGVKDVRIDGLGHVHYQASLWREIN